MHEITDGVHTRMFHCRDWVNSNWKLDEKLGHLWGLSREFKTIRDKDLRHDSVNEVLTFLEMYKNWEVTATILTAASSLCTHFNNKQPPQLCSHGWILIEGYFEEDVSRGIWRKNRQWLGGERGKKEKFYDETEENERQPRQTQLKNSSG